MSTNDKKKSQSLIAMAMNLFGCCSCSIFNPERRQNNHHYSATTTTITTSTTTTAASPFTAVEKDSAEPYLDFRASMLQMIVENEMYTKDDLRNLLTCFLQLNSPSLHGVIITAFTDIWNSIMFSSTSYSTPPAAHRRRRPRRGLNEQPPKAYVRPKSYHM